MNRDIDYLRHIQERIKRITGAASGRDVFFESEVIQDAVMRNFEIIGEATKRLSTEIKETQPDIPWRRIAGFRDILIHAYEDVDLDEVWRIIERDLEPLRQAVEAMLRSLETGDGES